MPDAIQKLKLFKYAHQRGFEAELIYELITEVDKLFPGS
jgi:hypothetical protein